MLVFCGGLLLARLEIDELGDMTELVVVVLRRVEVDVDVLLLLLVDGATWYSIR